MPELHILGRKIGTFEGYDIIADNCELYEGVTLDRISVQTIGQPQDKENSFIINYDSGYFEFYREDGEKIREVDILDALKDIPRV